MQLFGGQPKVSRYFHGWLKPEFRLAIGVIIMNVHCSI